VATRYFTLEQAQALLPRVRSLMGQALQLHGHLRIAISRLSDNGHEINWALLRGEVQLAESDDPGSDALERARMIYLTLRESVAQIEALGAEVKGVMDGLVDFHSWCDGDEDVLLCFKLGEPEIRWFHGLDEGYDSRRPVAGHRFTIECERDGDGDGDDNDNGDGDGDGDGGDDEHDDERDAKLEDDGGPLDDDDDDDEPQSAERERERQRQRDADAQRQ
jgi:hypothetical protein